MSSPSRRASPGEPGSGPMPSLARFRGAGGPGSTGGWYVVTKPGGRADRGLDPPVRSDRVRNVLVGVLSMGTVVGCALWAASHAGSLLGGLLLLLLGGSVGALAGGMVAVLLGGLSLPALGRRRDRDDRHRRVVRPADERAWRLCELGEALAASESWGDRTIDRDRRVPGILWSAVDRSLVVDRQFRDAERAVAHASLADLAQDTLARVAAERESLDAVEENLRAVLAAATRLDGLRARRALDRRSAQDREREERELRARLTGRAAATGRPVESYLQADSSAGLAAEAEVVAELLAESDAMLRDLD